jgi:predicted dehydrogenase
MDEQVRWGILGTGKIARIVGQAIDASRDGALVAVASRRADRATAFADEFASPAAHDGYAALIDDDRVDAVYVATHHPSHCTWAVAAAEAGKHVLCEKPIAVNHADASRIVAAARRNDVFLLEAFAYRCHPQTDRLVQLVAEGAIGEVRVIDAVFGYDAGTAPGNYLLDAQLAGGSILDIGCYTTSMAHLLAAAAIGAEVVEPLDVSGAGWVGPTGVDLTAAATITFEGGVLARVLSSIRANLDSSVRVFGSEGSISVASPWLPGRIGSGASIVVERPAGREVIDVDADVDPYAVEVDAVNGFIAAGQRSPSVMTWSDSLANLRTLDRWRAAVGLRYEDGEVEG